MMAGLSTLEGSRDPVAAVHTMLRATHERNAGAPLHLPTDRVFPSAIHVRPRPVVLDTHWLAKDVHYACVHGKRTTLVTAANQQAVRIFCAQHVIDEVVRHHELWSTGHAQAPISSEGFLCRWSREYLPLIRIVPDDAIPLAWLSPAEQQRVGVVVAAGSADVPSIKLVLALRGLYVSKDGQHSKPHTGTRVLSSTRSGSIVCEREATRPSYYACSISRESSANSERMGCTTVCAVCTTPSGR